jgi:hypothetical protein
MHLQQTKRESIKSGGPQYYFHDLSEAVKIYLRKKGAVKVALVTPYGATKTNFYAVGKDHKIDVRGKVVAGSVGHDRIQQGRAESSIGESIRTWYNLKGGDFERIDVGIETYDDCFYLTPIKTKYAVKGREQNLLKVDRPLTFSNQYISSFWKSQLEYLVRNKKQDTVQWAFKEICRVVSALKEKSSSSAGAGFVKGLWSAKTIGYFRRPVCWERI